VATPSYIRGLGTSTNPSREDAQEARTGEFYVGTDASDVQYRVYDSVNKRYQWIPKQQFLNNLSRNSAAIEQYKRLLNYDVINGVLDPDILQDIIKIQSEISSSNYLIESTGQSGFSLDTYLGGKAKSKGDGVTSTATVTDRNRAAEDLRTYAREYLGDIASGRLKNKDIKAYVTELNKLERSRPTIGRKGETISGGVSAEEREQLALKYILKYADNVPQGEELSGIVGNNLKTLKENASRYGIKKTDAELRRMALDSTRSETALQDQVNKFVTLAKSNYRGIADVLDTVSPYELAGNAISIVADELGKTPEQITLFDDPINWYLTQDKLPTLGDLRRYVRKTPGWERSDKAISLASSIVDRVKRDFGFIA
jgi:hypothetical protein